MIKNFVFSFILICGIVIAGADGTIRGNVAFESEPLIATNVYIAELGLGAMADKDGNYVIDNIPIGNYSVTASMIGFKTTKVEGVAVLRGETVWLNFNLPVAALEGEIVILSAENEVFKKDKNKNRFLTWIYNLITGN